MSNIELFIEFFFEILNEKCEPLIVFVEAVKCILRLKEYKALIQREKINSYIDIDSYKEMKRLKEIKDNHFYLVRSKKKMPKIKNFKVSERLEEMKKRMD